MNERERREKVCMLAECLKKSVGVCFTVRSVKTRQAIAFKYVL